MALNAKRIYLSIYLSIYLEVICLSVSLNAVFKRHTHFSWVYLPFCLPKCIFYHLPHIHTPPPPPRLQKCLRLFTCRSVCPPVCLSFRLSVCLFFSVCIRKQVRITRKFHNHYVDETQYTDSHTAARKHSKLISQFSGSFPQQNDCKTTCIKSLRTSPQN